MERNAMGGQPGGLTPHRVSLRNGAIDLPPYHFTGFDGRCA
jgi:hypothetical protein